MIGEFKKAKIKKEVNPTSRYLPHVFKVCLLTELAITAAYINMTVHECK